MEIGGIFRQWLPKEVRVSSNNVHESLLEEGVTSYRQESTNTSKVWM